MPQKTKKFIPEKPAMSDADLLSWIFLFPLKFSQFLINQLLGGLVGRMIMFGKPFTKEEKKKHVEYIKEKKRKSQDNHLTCKQLSVATYDGASLDTVEITNEVNDGTHIIYFSTIAGTYDDYLEEMVEHARDLQANTIAFSYRGMGNSTGTPCSIDDLITDGITQVQRLLASGVHPEKIMLKGSSLGGCVATLVAKYFHDRGQKVSLFNDRSFSSFTDVVVGWLRTCFCSGHHEWSLMKLISGLFKPLIFGFLWLNNWEADVVGAFNSIPDDYKKYLLVRSPKPLRSYFGSCAGDDNIIPHYASLHQGIKDRAVLKDVLIGLAGGFFIGLAAAGIVAATGGTALLALVILPPAAMFVIAAANAVLGIIQRSVNKQEKKAAAFEESKQFWPQKNKPCPETFEEALVNKKNYKVVKGSSVDPSLGNFYSAYHFFRNPNKMIEVDDQDHSWGSAMENNSPDNTLAMSFFSNPHMVSSKCLVNAQGQTGWQFFQNFFRKNRYDYKCLKKDSIGNSILRL